MNLFSEMVERFAIGAYTPLEAWLLVVVVLLVPTAVVYVVLQRMQANHASLQGKVGSFTVNLAGPAAFYGILLLWSSSHIDKIDETVPTVSLSGEVRDILGQPVSEGIWVAALTHKDKVNPDGTFDIRVPQPDDGAYELIAFNDWGFVRLEDFVAEKPHRPSGAVIGGFPHQSFTTIVGGPFNDQFSNPIKDVEIYVSAQVNPEPLFYSGHDAPAQIRIEKGSYLVEIRNRETQEVIWDQDISNVVPGGLYRLRPQLNVKKTQLSQAE